MCYEVIKVNLRFWTKDRRIQTNQAKQAKTTQIKNRCNCREWFLEHTENMSFMFGLNDIWFVIERRIAWTVLFILKVVASFIEKLTANPTEPNKFYNIRIESIHRVEAKCSLFQ